MLTYLLLTDRCNLNCSHCIRGERRHRDMSMEDFTCAVDEVLSVYPMSSFVLTGGEPTLNPEFECMLAYALKTCKAEIIVNSNGTTSFYDNIGRYAGFKKLHIQFSIDGTPIEHDRIRGAGSFGKMERNIGRLRESGVRLWVSTVVTEANLKSIFELRDMLVDYNVEKWHVNPVLPFGCGAKLGLVPVEKWNALVDELIETTPLRLGIKKLYDFSSIENSNSEEFKSLVASAKGKHYCNCGSGNRKLYVYPDLAVYGCTCLKDFPFGNLGREPLSTIMESDIAKRIRCYCLEESSPCQRCEYLPICNGGCIGMSYHEFGRLGVGDIRCPKFRNLSCG